MIRIRGQSLDRRDLLALDCPQWGDARSDGAAVQVDGAGAADAAPATKFRAAQF